MAHTAYLLLAATAMLAPQLGHTVILEESRKPVAGQGEPVQGAFGAAFKPGVGSAGGALTISDLGGGLKKPFFVGVSADSNGIKGTVGTSLGRDKYFEKSTGIPYRVEKSGMGVAVSGELSKGKPMSLTRHVLGGSARDYYNGWKAGASYGGSVNTEGIAGSIKKVASREGAKGKYSLTAEASGVLSKGLTGGVKGSLNAKHRGALDYEEGDAYVANDLKDVTIAGARGTASGVLAPGVLTRSEAVLNGKGIKKDKSFNMDLHARSGTKSKFGRGYGKIKGALKGAAGKGLSGFMAGVADASAEFPAGFKATANGKTQGTLIKSPGKQLAGDISGTAWANATGPSGSLLGLTLNGKVHMVGPKSSK